MREAVFFTEHGAVIQISVVEIEVMGGVAKLEGSEKSQIGLH